MKKIVFALNLILLMTLGSFAQEKEFKKDPNQVDNYKPVPRQKSGQKESDEKATPSTEAMENTLLQSGTNLDAKLISTLDVRKSKVGDEVVLKTTESIKQEGEVIVPKGTKLIGRVTEVRRKTDENKSSSLSMVFESLQNKNLSAPISATVVSITNAKGNAAAQGFGADTMGSTSTTGGVSRGSSSGGGLLGGATSTVGGVLNTTTGTLGAATNTIGSTAAGSTQMLGGTLQGISLNQSASASASGSTTLTAENKNIRLEKGTHFQLQLTESVQN